VTERPNVDDLVRQVDALEDAADSYLTLEEVQAAAGSDVGWAVEQKLLLVDFRTRLDGSQVSLCRLNRRHPRVVELTSW
jgi:hypothetical protein